jgi:hypothetical protein
MTGDHDSTVKALWHHRLADLGPGCAIETAAL